MKSKGWRRGAWPPPRHIRRILSAARTRYRKLKFYERPALNHVGCYLSLFTEEEARVLREWGYLLLPPQAQRFMRIPQYVTDARRRRFEQRVAAVVRDLLAKELPEAVEYILRRRRAQ